jgi:hypothetical protein
MFRQLIKRNRAFTQFNRASVLSLSSSVLPEAKQVPRITMGRTNGRSYGTSPYITFKLDEKLSITQPTLRLSMLKATMTSLDDISPNDGDYTQSVGIY